jgi:hypothetical protein
MQKKLTQAQLDKLPYYRDKWIAIGLATGPCDRPTVEKSVDLLYTCGGLAPPTYKIWARSPMEGAHIAQLLLPESADGKTIADIQAMITSGKPIVALDITSAILSHARFGQHDAGWLSLYDHEFNEVGRAQVENIRGLLEMAQCGWYWAFDQAIVLCERATELHRDEQFRLHNTMGAAIKFPDGFGVHAIHGVRLPADIIEDPKSITVKRIQTENNAEIRRVMVEKYGLDRYLTDSGAKVISKDAFGSLLSSNQDDDEPIVAVQVLNSTPEPDGSTRTYIIRVPPTMKTPQEALAWTFGLKENEYKPEIET